MKIDYSKLKKDENISSKEIEEMFEKYKNEREYKRYVLYSAIASHPKTPYKILKSLANSEDFKMFLLLNTSYPSSDIKRLEFDTIMKLYTFMNRKKLKTVNNYRLMAEKEHEKKMKKLKKQIGKRKKVKIK